MRLLVYTDGSATERSGRAGGWAFVLVRDGVEVAAGTGGARFTTNNLMELAAARAGLEAAVAHLADGEKPELVTDSRYVIDELGGPAAGGIITRWIRGHSGDPWNERVDALAHQAKQAFIPAKVRRRLERRRRG